MSDAAGYSGTPLAQKLGLKDGQRVLFVDLPETLADLAATRTFAAVERVTLAQVGDAGRGYDVVHIFTAARSVLEDMLARLMQLIARDGMIWVSWPKKAAKIATDVTEDVIREICLPLGLVDVKVCAVDAVWSGLKLVIRKELR
jgi:hypothetical protein